MAVKQSPEQAGLTAPHTQPHLKGEFAGHPEGPPEGIEEALLPILKDEADITFFTFRLLHLPHFIISPDLADVVTTSKWAAQSSHTYS